MPVTPDPSGEDVNDFLSAEPDDLDPADEIERALDACGQTDVPGFCWHAGTEYCDFWCRFRASLSEGTTHKEPGDVPL
mgnify:FL=1